METSLISPLESGAILIDRVYQSLLDAISDGSLPPGLRIRQDELANRLGVSRQPVSHALHLLKRQNLVREHRRKGFEVAPIDPVRLRQLYEVRGAMDGFAARLAAGRAAKDKPGCRLLSGVLKAGRSVTGTASAIALVQLDVEFHQALYRMSANPVFGEVVGPHWPHLRRSMATVIADRGYRKRVWAEHAAIAAFVLGGDGDGAEHAARAHAIAAGRNTEQRLTALAQENKEEAP